MELFGRELSLEQMVGLVECNATPDEDLVHRAALDIIAALRESQRRADAAVEDLSTYKDCGFCIHLQDQQYCYKNCQRHVDVDNFRTHPCWQWRGPVAEKGETHE